MNDILPPASSPPTPGVCKQYVAEDGESIELVVTMDEEGDFLVRDMDRDGLLCHAGTLPEALAAYWDARELYDKAEDAQHRR